MTITPDSATSRPSAPPHSTDGVPQQIGQLLARLTATNLGAVFGTPIERGGTTIIPCLEVISGMGLGGGFGFGRAPQTRSAAESSSGAEFARGEGGGGGGGVRGRPIAVLVVTADKVSVMPVIDVTRIVIAGLASFGTGAMLLAALAGRRNRRRRPSPGGQP